jgi:hypothetical protein
MAEKKWRRGERLSEEDLEKVKPGDYVWVYWCKDDNPEDCRWNHAVPVTAIETDSRGMKSMLDDEGYNWNFNGDCSGRGIATYYEALPV